MTMTERPGEDEYAPHFGKYVSLVTEPDVLTVLRAQADLITRVASNVTADRETFRYGPEKWSIREVFGHLNDGERVFGYRAVCISRGDASHFPSFDENLYVANSRFDEVPLGELLEEFQHLRAANAIALERMDERAWTTVGTASGRQMSVRAFAYVMVGHVRHHLEILHDRYGVPRP